MIFRKVSKIQPVRSHFEKPKSQSEAGEFSAQPMRELSMVGTQQGYSKEDYAEIQ